MRKGWTIRMFALSILLLTAVGAAPGRGTSGPSASLRTRVVTTGERPHHTVPVRLSSPLSLPGPIGVFATGPNFPVIVKPGAQSETTIAVDPTDKRHLLAASNDLADTTIVYESFNNGKTWVNANLGLTQFCYDPWLDFNANGDAFFAYECSDQRIAYRLAGSTTWVKTLLGNAGSFPDRDMVTVDTGAGSAFLDSVYIGYDDFGANNAAFLLYDRDGIPPYTRTPKINDTSSTIGVNAATAADGSVYAVWEDFNGGKIWADRSTNGGATWGTDHMVTDYRLNTVPFFLCIPPQPDRCVVPMPFSDAAPAGGAFAGRVYVTYPDRAVATSDWDVFVRFSDDGGVTWSPEAEVSDEGAVTAYQFFPAISVAPDGTVGVSFYDTRDDQPANEKTHRYISFSVDGGVTWSANERLSTAQSDESGFGDANDYGDYEGTDAGPTGRFHNIWTDSRPAADGEDMVNAAARP